MNKPKPKLKVYRITPTSSSMWSCSYNGYQETGDSPKVAYNRLVSRVNNANIMLGRSFCLPMKYA